VPPDPPDRHPPAPRRRITKTKRRKAKTAAKGNRRGRKKRSAFGF
jgi:hypothetical protein